MTVRELRKKLREFNPDAVVMLNGNIDDIFSSMSDIGHIRYHCAKGIDDPWRADIVEISSDEEEEDV